METIILQRRPSTPNGMQGEMRRNGSHLCFTMERPWLNNKPMVSAIPAGVYPVKRYSSQRFPAAFSIEGVHGRANILIHNANIMTELEGCVAVGDKLGVLQNLPAVLNSVNTLKMLRATLPGEFLLDVRDA